MNLKERTIAIKRAISEEYDGAEEPVNANTIILSYYLQAFEPVATFGPGVVVMATDEIISELTSMADLEPAEVNRCLASMGYLPGRNDAGVFGGLLKRINR